MFFIDLIGWKLRLQILMEEAGVWKHILIVIPEPTDPAQLAGHRKKEAKENRIVIDSVKDNFISHVA